MPRRGGLKCVYDEAGVMFRYWLLELCWCPHLVWSWRQRETYSFPQRIELCLPFHSRRVTYPAILTFFKRKYVCQKLKHVLLQRIFFTKFTTFCLESQWSSSLLYCLAAGSLLIFFHYFLILLLKRWNITLKQASGTLFNTEMLASW